MIVTRSFQCIENKFEEEGIFRKSGLHSHIQGLRDTLDQGYSVLEVITEGTDCHSITGLLKLYIRELPTPLISDKLMNQLIKILKDTSILEKERIEQIKSVILLVVKLERNLLGYICKMLKKVSLLHEKNKMTVSNLAIVWAPTLLGTTITICPDAQCSTILNLHTDLTSIFIAEADYLFNSSETLDTSSSRATAPLSTSRIRTTTHRTTPRTSQDSNLSTSSSYSQSMDLLPSFTSIHTLGQKPQNSIPCLKVSLYTTETLTPELTPRSYGCPVSEISEGIRTGLVAESETSGTVGNSQIETSSVNSGESFKEEMAEEMKENEGFNHTVKFETPRPNQRYCSTRRKNHIYSHSDVNNNLSLKGLFSPPVLNLEVYNNNPPIPNRVFMKTSPKKKPEKKRLPSSPINKRTLKKRPGRMVNSSKRTPSNISAFPDPIGGLKRISCYYQSNKPQLMETISNFFINNGIIPYRTRYETTSPIEFEEALRLFHSYNTLLIINKMGAIRFMGSVSYLSDDQVKKLTLRKTNSLKSPAIFLKRDSILILGWSEDIWSNYLKSQI